MNNSYVECDLSKFGGREIRDLRDLLTAYLQSNKTKLFGEIDKVGFNLNSGYVFLLDSDQNCAMDQDGSLYDFLTCPECGNEGLSIEFDTDQKCCKEYFEGLS